MQTTTYDYRKLVTIGDTNAMGNVYFAEYFMLQGVVRETWVRDAVANGLRHLADGLVLSTRSAHCEYRKSFYVFDTIVCRMHVEELARVSAKLVFEFYKEGAANLHAFGWQHIVFKDRASNRKVPSAP